MNLIQKIKLFFAKKPKEYRRPLATIATIDDIIPIPGAEQIGLALIRGWKAIVRYDEFKKGDKCIFFEVDSLLPSSNPAFAFMSKYNYRVKTIKLKGVYSQGLVGNLSLLPNGNWKVGMGVDDILGIVKYEKPSANNGVGGQGSKGNPSNFPTFIPKTDEERIQNCEYVLKQYADLMYVATEKLDGSSFTAYVKDGQFGVCSRNYDLDLTNEDNHLNNVFVKTADRLMLKERMLGLGMNIAIQGEIIGPAIQENKYKLQSVNLYLFNAFDIDNSKYMSYSDMRDIARKLGLNTVPELSVGPLLEGSSIDELIAQVITRKSRINPDCNIEGIVVRPVTDKVCFTLPNARLSFKIINPEWLVKYDE